MLERSASTPEKNLGAYGDGGAVVTDNVSPCVANSNARESWSHLEI